MTSPQQELRSSKRPGQMTAAMRVSASVAPSRQGPKLLRVGLVQNGSVREERTLAASAHVSVGTNEDNAFLLGGSAQPPSFRLFERADGAYQLNFTDEMQGRVALASGLFELQSLKTKAHRTAQGTYRIALTDEARGRVSLGDVAFLFHFVEPPPVRPKAVLPSSVLRGSAGVDWNSTICAAFSFLLHFMILGAVYSDWADPVIDDDLSTAGLIDSLKNLPPPPPIEDKEIPDEPKDPVEKTQPKANPNDAAPPKPASRANFATPRSPIGDAMLVEKLASIDTSIIGALTTANPATSGVLRKSEIGWGALDSAVATAAGVGTNSGPDLGSAGGSIRRGTFQDLRDVGTKTIGPEGHGRVTTVAGPRAVANVAPPSTVGGVVGNAASIVASMRAGFRACYQRGLAENPDASGAIRLSIRVGAGGEVTGVTASPSGNLPPTVVSCVQARAKAAQFDAPEGGSAVILVPVNFVKQ